MIRRLESLSRIILLSKLESVYIEHHFPMAGSVESVLLLRKSYVRLFSLI